MIPREKTTVVIKTEQEQSTKADHGGRPLCGTMTPEAILTNHRRSPS